ncbi:Uncharacterised protein [Amycolatopsis camponoti]|uniref:Uncharacterized protein n=1 Tax=Amycolatopsis camponoti TaxID=2606593 RepID=A0A6I8LXE8_9PSEU|nr:DUF5994 family protein [Amycolatopsis camponoti]VVJ21817.1 Uncharacterised protein [Amycolatopsis camponoti]
MTAVRDEVRLQRKPAAGGGYVDGAWWPRSREAGVEFADLITAARDQVGQVERIGYPLGDGWELTHRKLVVDGHLVRLEGFHAMPAHTLTLIGTQQRRLTLLVIAPGTPQDTATTVLRTAADPDDTASPDDLLAARSGRRRGQTGSEPALPGAEV